MLIHVGMWSGFVLKFFDSACLSLFLCLSQTMISLSSSCVSSPSPPPQYSFATTSELLKIFPAFLASEDFLIFSQERRKTINSQKRWMDGNNSWRIYGDFLHVKYLTSTNTASLLTSHMLQMTLRQYTVRHECYTWLQAAIKITDKATLS